MFHPVKIPARMSKKMRFYLAHIAVKRARRYAVLTAKFFARHHFSVRQFVVQLEYQSYFHRLLSLQTAPSFGNISPAIAPII